MRRFVGRQDVVVIKPNIAWDRTPEQAANTNPEAGGGGGAAVLAGGRQARDRDRRELQRAAALLSCARASRPRRGPRAPK